MLRIEKFDPTKTYMFVDGTLATPEIIRKNNPAIDTFTHVLELNGDVVQAIMNLSALRGIYKIDKALTDDEAVLTIETITNTPPPVVISPEERTAAAMEFSNLMLLADVAVNPVDPTITVEDSPVATLVKQNYKKGLWSDPMVDKAALKGAISVAQKTTIKNTVITPK